MAENTKPSTDLTADQRRELLRQILEKKARQPRDFPLSLGQDALWFLDRLDPGRPTYGFYPAIRVRGMLDIAALQRAFGELVRRHDVFRTTFPEIDGSPVQRVTPFTDYVMSIVDLRDQPAEQRERECRRLAEDRPPLDLQNGPLLRARLIRLTDDDQVVSVHLHHIVFDGWSLGVLIREIFALYGAFKSGGASPLPPLSVQFADFAAWQRKHLQGEVLSKLQTHWRQRLAGLPPLELFTDHPRPAVRTSRGSAVPLVLSAELSKGVIEFSRREHFTPFMTLLAGFQELLRRYSGQDDFAIGTPTANRRQKSFEPLIGYFINVLVLRADVSKDPTFLDLVGRVRDTALDAFQNQELTLDKIVEAVAPPRDLSRHPLFQVMFVVQNNPRPSLVVPGIELAPLGEMEPAGSAKFELTVPLRMNTQGCFEGRINFNTDLFTHDTVARMAEHFQLILAEAIARPNERLSRLNLLRDDERRRITVEWNSRVLPVAAARLLPDRFSEHARRTPASIAVIDAKRTWTYGELDAASNRLARRLQALGVGPERPVGVCMERSGELMTVLLAILKSGGAYVPLDPGHAGAADERVKFILDDAQATLVVTDEAHRGLLPIDDSRVLVLDRLSEELAASSAEPVAHGATPETLAYVIYTSGSTGRPKGVMVTHGNLENAYLGWEHEYRLGTEVVSHLQMASFGFDVFTGDWTRAFGSGGKLVFCSKETMLEPAELLQLLRREQIDAAEFVPVVLRNLVQHVAQQGEKLDSLKMVAVGSDAWYVEDHERALEVLGPSTRLVNSYGLTETTIDSTFFEGNVSSLPPTGIVPIGRPFPNVQAYALDAWRRPVPVGVAGELYIGGAGVARGYLNRPELDAERFVPDMFSSTPGARLCRTGDRVRWRKDGQLEFLGRADDQVKIRGFRIEPGEVEEVLREHPALAEAAVLAKERSPGDLRLVAYVAARPGLKPFTAELRKFLGERLPEYMVPTAFVTLDSMPTTPNGKVDRRSLPEPKWEQSLGASEYVAPRTPIEEQLAVIWSEILNVPRVSAHDSFFELGGNSLMAVRLVARIRMEFQVDVPLVALFTAPTLDALGERITDLATTGVRPTTKPIPKVSREGGVRIAVAQEIFWTISQMYPDRPISNVYAAVMLRGELDVPTLERTVTEIVRRHETMRTYFLANEDGEPRQFIAPPAPVTLAMTDLSHLSEDERKAEVQRRAREQNSLVFALDRPPMYRLSLVKLSDREHALLMCVHHIVFDGWSLHVLIREVSELYEAYRAGLGAPLAELPVQYADYAVWERESLQGEELERLLAYWRGQLIGATNPELPFKRTAAPGVRHMRDAIEHALPEDWPGRLEQFGRDHGATNFNVLLACYFAVLHRYCTTEDLTIAVPVANRGRAETQRMIGVFINTIFVRSQVTGDLTFAELLARVQAVFVAGTNHERLPMTNLVQELLPDYNPSRFPISQIMFNYLQPGAAGRARKRRELEIDVIPSDRDPISTRTDLSLTIAHARGKLRANFKFDATFFAREDMERFARHFTAFVESVLAAPEQRIASVPLLSEAERQHIVGDWNATDVAFETPSGFQEFVEEQVKLHGDRPAVVFEKATQTYAELNLRANQLAHRLRELGVRPDDHVGVCLERSLDLPAIVLGIMKSGGAYLPLDPSYPRERLEFMATDGEPRVIVTTSALAERLGAAPAFKLMVDVEQAELARQPANDPEHRTTPDHAIYVIYTSGSTGKPKGAINLHRALLSRMMWERQQFQHRAGDRYLLKTSLNFDPSFTEMFRPLCNGGVLVVARPGGERDPDYLADIIEREQICMTSFVPSMLRLFLERDDLRSKCQSLRFITCGGEAMTSDLAALFREKLSARLFNMYGPAETAISVTYFDCSEATVGETVPLGRPMANVRLYVLDSLGQPQPIGVPGELYIGGAPVGRGYWNRPELTAERFVRDPFVDRPDAIMYKTGDVCRYQPDGKIEFLGRVDSQVKIRGQRVELGEIESRLAAYDNVSAAAVLARGAGESMTLIAYVVPRNVDTNEIGGETQPSDVLRRYLSESLPEYMIPAEFLFLPALPTLPNGKVNRTALSALASQRTTVKAARSYEPPRGDVEPRIAAIWESILQLPRIGRNEDFFQLGGHSLQAIRMMRQVGQEFKIDLSVTELFATRTVAGLAKHVESIAPGPAASTTSPAAVGDSATSPTDVLVPASSEPPLAKPTVEPPVPATPTEPGVAARASSARHRRWLAPLRAKGDGLPLFCIHGLGGHIAGFLPLAKQLREGRPVYGLQGQGLDGAAAPHDRIDEMAAGYVEEIRQVRPEGPYLISGWSLGGLIALEVAQRLTAAGQRVPLLAMYDTYLRVSNRDVPEMSDASLMIRIAPQLRIPLGQLQILSPQQQWDLIAERAAQSAGVGIEEIRRLADTCKAHMRAVAKYQPRTYVGSVMLFRAESARGELDPRWPEICPRMRVAVVPGDHYSMLQPPHVDVLAARLDAELAAAELSAAPQESRR